MLDAILQLWRIYALTVATHNPTAAAYAVIAETRDVSAATLLAVAWIESRFTDDAISRVEHGRRTTTRPGPTTLRDSQGPRFCGPLQTAAGHSRSACAHMRGLAGWRVGAAEIETWLKFCRGDLVCALSGYGCGVRGARAKSCAPNPENGQTYADRVIWIRRQIAAKAPGLPVVPRFRVLPSPAYPHANNAGI